MKVYYVTGNEGKVKLANKIFKDLDIEIIQEDIETPEIQSLDCKEVASYSAKYAANLLNKPVVKNDSGLIIDALKGFPGALAKYAEDTITAEGYIKLLKGIDNRNARWIEVLAYCEPNKEPITFTSISEGSISTKVRGTRGYDFDKIYIPNGYTKTFAELDEEEWLSTFSDEAYIKLYEHLKKISKN